MKKFIGLLAIALLLFSGDAYASKAYWRSALTEGADALAAINHAILNSGDLGIVGALDGTTATFYVYVYDSTATNTTDSPDRIAPTSGGGAWRLCESTFYKIVTSSADGEAYVNVSNSGDFTGTATEGDCYYRKDTKKWCCYDGSNWLCTDLVGAPQ